jgi:hypothetical protein
MWVVVVESGSHAIVCGSMAAGLHSTGKRPSNQLDDLRNHVVPPLGGFPAVQLPEGGTTRTFPYH